METREARVVVARVVLPVVVVSLVALLRVVDPVVVVVPSDVP